MKLREKARKRGSIAQQEKARNDKKKTTAKISSKTNVTVFQGFLPIVGTSDAAKDVFKRKGL